MNTSNFIMLLHRRSEELESELRKIDVKTNGDLDKLNELYFRLEEVHYIWDMINKG
jgi:hypothetical protein